MAMVVQHNMQAMNSQRQLGVTSLAQSKSTEKLSSGYKINRAADDAAGLTISEKMRSQIRGLSQASNNAQDGISLVQTAEGALTEVHSMLQRMNELATKAANGTLTTSDRTAIQKELNALVSEINRVQQSTEFNTKGLLSGTFNTRLQVGAKGDVIQTIKISIAPMDAKGLNLATANKKMRTTLQVNTGTNNFQISSARKLMTAVQAAISIVSAQRSALGAVQNRLEHTIANLDNIVENTQSAESLIRDTDMAKEMVEYSKNNILAQAGQSMLAQANQSTQGVLSLLG